MNFPELIDELNDRGFDQVTDDRLGRYVNQAYQSLCNRAQWPFLETFALGPAPLTISDLRAVLSVRDNTTEALLQWMDRRDILFNFGSTSTEGSPSYWYQTSRSEIRVFPVNTDPLTVYYLKVPPTLTDTDEHLIPEEFEDLILDGAAIRAHRDQREYDSVNVLSGFYNERLREMFDALLMRHHDGGGFIRQTQNYEG